MGAKREIRRRNITKTGKEGGCRAEELYMKSSFGHQLEQAAIGQNSENPGNTVNMEESQLTGRRKQPMKPTHCATVDKTCISYC